MTQHVLVLCRNKPFDSECAYMRGYDLKNVCLWFWLSERIAFQVNLVNLRWRLKGPVII